MKDNKDKEIKFRISAKDKDSIYKSAEKYGMTVSDFIRTACERMEVK